MDYSNYALIQDILIFLIIGMTFISGGLFLVKRKAFNASETAFGYYLLLNSVFEIIAWSSISVFGFSNNLPGLHLYTLLEFVFITNFAVASLQMIKGLPAMIILTVGSLLIIFNSVCVQNIYTYNSISLAGVKIYTLIISIIFFYKILSTKKYSIVNIRPSVYFYTAIFLNACTSVIWYMYSNKILILSNIMDQQLSIVKNSAATLASIIILTGLYYIVKRKENDLI